MHQNCPSGRWATKSPAAIWGVPVGGAEYGDGGIRIEKSRQHTVAARQSQHYGVKEVRNRYFVFLCKIIQIIAFFRPSHNRQGKLDGKRARSVVRGGED